ncbi:hypothetical protein FRC00_008208 [Tulasnella sp. 408]|nr:hypothetical protein FRC00_008208 [Tulasnella sp. 408]
MPSAIAEHDEALEEEDSFSANPLNFTPGRFQSLGALNDVDDGILDQFKAIKANLDQGNSLSPLSERETRSTIYSDPASWAPFSQRRRNSERDNILNIYDANSPDPFGEVPNGSAALPLPTTALSNGSGSEPITIAARAPPHSAPDRPCPPLPGATVFFNAFDVSHNGPPLASQFNFATAALHQNWMQPSGPSTSTPFDPPQVINFVDQDFGGVHVAAATDGMMGGAMPPSATSPPPSPSLSSPSVSAPVYNGPNPNFLHSGNAAGGASSATAPPPPPTIHHPNPHEVSQSSLRSSSPPSPTPESSRESGHSYPPTTRHSGGPPSVPNQPQTAQQHGGFALDMSVYNARRTSLGPGLMPPRMTQRRSGMSPNIPAGWRDERDQMMTGGLVDPTWPTTNQQLQFADVHHHWPHGMHAEQSLNSPQSNGPQHPRLVVNRASAFVTSCLGVARHSVDDGAGKRWTNLGLDQANLGLGPPPTKLNPMEIFDSVFITVTADAKNYFMVDVTGAKRATFIRERIFSKLSIPDDQRENYQIYRPEPGGATLGNPVTGNELMIYCEAWADAKGTLKFLIQHNATEPPSWPQSERPSWPQSERVVEESGGRGPGDPWAVGYTRRSHKPPTSRLDRSDFSPTPPTTPPSDMIPLIGMPSRRPQLYKQADVSADAVYLNPKTLVDDRRRESNTAALGSEQAADGQELYWEAQKPEHDSQYQKGRAEKNESSLGQHHLDGDDGFTSLGRKADRSESVDSSVSSGWVLLENVFPPAPGATGPQRYQGTTSSYGHPSTTGRVSELADPQQDDRREHPASIFHSVDLAREVDSLQTESIPATEEIVNALLVLAEAIPKVIRNKHKLYRIFFCVRDICAELHRMPNRSIESTDWIGVLDDLTETLDSLTQLVPLTFCSPSLYQTEAIS